MRETTTLPPPGLPSSQAAPIFADLADTLRDDFDLTAHLRMLVQRSVELLGVSAAAVTTLDEHRHLDGGAASCRAAHLLALFAVQTQEGPSIDCARDGRSVTSPDLPGERHRWPRFTAAAHECGYRAAHALPLRLREQFLGVLTLLDAEPGPLDEARWQLGHALATIATIGLLQRRAITRADQLAEQLQRALSSRIVIEQAKGVLAHYGRVDMATAFARLRGYARSHSQRLADLSGSVVAGHIDLDTLCRPDDAR